jgi:superfamily II DNA or RNA helicase
VQLATGTGKTITALSAAITLFEKANLELLIVVCPYRHLVTQWNEEAVKFGLKPILAFENSKKWAPNVDRFLAYGRENDQKLPVIISTMATFSMEGFQVRLNLIPERSFIIGDEVHNFGSKKIRKRLPANIPWRMGLSATPERWFDPIGTKEIFDYFGEIVEPKVTLKEALKWGVLTTYYYYPVLVELSDEEYEIYLELTEKIGKMFAMGESIDDEDGPLQSLLIKRARLIASAENKIVELEKLARSWEEPSHLLVYCGDGSVDVDVDEMSIRHIDQVTQLPWE